MDLEILIVFGDDYQVSRDIFYWEIELNLELKSLEINLGGESDKVTIFDRIESKIRANLRDATRPIRPVRVGR